MVPLSTAFSWMAIGAEDDLSELIRAISWHWLKVGPTAVRSLNDLIRLEPSNEPAFQDFFCEHPQFLDPLAMEVWSQPDFHGRYRPDFLIRRADESYVVIEIECPAKLLMTQAGQLSEPATHAEKQATDYRAFLDERIQEARRNFPGYASADCLAIVGLESSLSVDQLSALARVNASRHNVTVMGFDRVAQRASAIAANVSSADNVRVIRGHRFV